jgi:hypothetical protein
MYNYWIVTSRRYDWLSMYQGWGKEECIQNFGGNMFWKKATWNTAEEMRI